MPKAAHNRLVNELQLIYVACKLTVNRYERPYTVTAYTVDKTISIWTQIQLDTGINVAANSCCYIASWTTVIG